MAVLTVAAGEEVLAAHHNANAGLTNGTVGYGQPVKHVIFDDDAIYSETIGNQDTTNGLALKVQYGSYLSPTTIATFAKAGVTFSVPTTYTEALQGRLLDKGGEVFNLEAYAAGVTINNGSGDTDTAWSAALAAITLAGGAGTIQLGRGTYLAPTSAVTWVDNVTVRGAGMDVTTVKHRDSSTREPFNWVGRSNMTLCDLTVDGNRANNNNISTGFNSAEVALEGTDNAAFRVRVRDFNKVGISCGGTRTVVAFCKVGLISPPGSYTAVNGVNEYAYDGLYGINSPGNYVATDIIVHGNQVYGLRSAGIFVGGKGFAITDNHIRDCHRGPYPLVGGGQMALSLSKTTVDEDTVPQNGVISGNTIGDTVVGTYASGMELNAAIYCTVTGNSINGQPATGIAMEATTGIQIVGNTIFNCVTGIGVTANTGSFAIIGNSITTCSTTGISLSGTTTHFSVIGNYFDGNAAGATGNINNASSGTNYEMLGNIFVSGTAIANRQLALTLNQGAGDGEILTLKSSDVAHGMTSLTDTDTYGVLSKVTATEGGVNLVGYTEGEVAVRLTGRYTTDNTTKSTAGAGAVSILAQLKSGTSAGAMTGNANILTVSENTNTRFILDADGDSHQDIGTSWTNYDDLQDVVALTTLSHELARPGNPISEEFGRFLSQDRQMLEDAKLVSFNDGPGGDGRAFVNMSKLLMLTVGAVRQVALNVARIEDRLQALPSGGA